MWILILKLDENRRTCSENEVFLALFIVFVQLVSCCRVFHPRYRQLRCIHDFCPVLFPHGHDETLRNILISSALLCISIVTSNTKRGVGVGFSFYFTISEAGHLDFFFTSSFSKKKKSSWCTTDFEIVFVYYIVHLRFQIFRE